MVGAPRSHRVDVRPYDTDEESSLTRTRGRSLKQVDPLQLSDCDQLIGCVLLASLAGICSHVTC